MVPNLLPHIGDAGVVVFAEQCERVLICRIDAFGIKLFVAVEEVIDGRRVKIAMEGSREMSGMFCSHSHFDTAAFVTPKWFATSSWVSPLPARKDASFLQMGASIRNPSAARMIRLSISRMPQTSEHSDTFKSFASTTG